MTSTSLTFMVTFEASDGAVKTITLRAQTYHDGYAAAEDACPDGWTLLSVQATG